MSGSDATPSSSTEVLGVTTGALTEDLWLVMDRLGRDGRAQTRFLDGVNPRENVVWLAYGYDPTLMQFTGGWAGVTYVCT